MTLIFILPEFEYSAEDEGDENEGGEDYKERLLSAGGSCHF